MTDAAYTKLKDQVVAFLTRHPKESFKPRVLARRLSIKGLEDYRLLTRVLNELAQGGTITRGNRKRYGHGVPEPASRLTGTFAFQSGGAGLVRLFPPEEESVVIPPRFIGTALHGDTVSIALHARTGDEERPEGEVIEVLERSQRPAVGTFEKSKHFFFVVPDDRRIPRDIYIPKGKTLGARPGDKVVARVTAWESRQLNPEGEITEVLGRAGEVSAEMAGVAREFQLPLRFPREVSEEASRCEAEISAQEVKKRADLRELVCFTIDPEDAKDFDDAVSLRELPGGNLELGVHIADVSHYVTPGSALDREALSRGTSVYLANDVIPMLPERLSNDLCSLRQRVDRLAYSALITVTPKGIVEDSRITKSVIHSRRRFTYEEVQRIIETGRGEHATVIREMQRLSATLLAKRMKAGSIDFDSAETKFRFDQHGKPVEIVKKQRLDAHRLVEEFMLLANQVVAETIGRVRKESQVRPFIYRIHDMPPPEKLKDLAAFVQHLGYSLPTSGGVSSRALQKLLNDVRGTEEENVVNEVAIRSMAKAVYSDENIGHFGLGFKHYTHFTSPIRRYPDLIVHRLLHEYEHAMPLKRRNELTGLLPVICKQSSDRERVAMEAERASVKVMQVEYMRRHVGDTFSAIISGVANFGFFVEIVDLLVEGLVRVRDLEDDYYVFDERRYALVGRKTKKRYRLGDHVTVRVVRVDPEERQIDFLLVP